MRMTKCKIAVIGAGWNGCRIACTLAKSGHDVSLFEKAPDIFSGVSGAWGIRLHQGPHYPRSAFTRSMCRRDAASFTEKEPDLVIPHDQSIYAHGVEDALGYPSKVSGETFRDVCYESAGCRDVKSGQHELENVHAVYDLPEPSIVIGERLRKAFKVRLHNAGVTVCLGENVTRIEENGDASILSTSKGEYSFDIVINTTAYESLIPNDVPPLKDAVVYQVCLGFVYEDQQPQERPFSLIVMDGWFPCIMPMVDSDKPPHTQYVVYHGYYNIVHSSNTHTAAQHYLNKLQDDTSKPILDKIRTSVEADVARFWPQFQHRFRYKSWQGNVLAKLKTRTEFRSGLVYEKDGTIYVFPGKVSNVMTAEEEVKVLIEHVIQRRDRLYKESQVVHVDGISFTRDSGFATAMEEISARPAPGERHTSNL